MWSTGPVGNNHRAVMRDGKVVAVAESVEEAAHIVRTMNATMFEPLTSVVESVTLFGWIDDAEELTWLSTRDIVTRENIESGWKILYVKSQ